MSSFHQDKRIANSIPDAFAELLQPVCAGRALMSPRKASDRGGALGDLGYFNDGGFTKEFNIYDRSACSLALPKRAMAWVTDQPYTTDMPLVSSQLSETKFEFDAAVGTDVLLPAVPPIKVQPKVEFSDDDYEYASLYAYKPAKYDYMLDSEVIAVVKWLLKNAHITLPRHCVLTSVVRSSGWISTYQKRHKRSVSLLGRVQSALGGIGGSASRSVNKNLRKVTRGPEDWEDGTPAEYPIIMGYAQAMSRTQRILAGFKIPVADSAMGDAPFASEGSLAAAAPPGASTQFNASTPSPAPQSSSTEAVDLPLASCSDDVPGNILIGFLQALLDRREDIAVVAGDTSIIMHFVEKYGKMPVNSEVTFVVDTHRSDGNTTATEGEIVAILHELVPSDSAAATVVERSLEVKEEDSVPSPAASQAAPPGVMHENDVIDTVSNEPTTLSSLSTGGSSAFSASVHRASNDSGSRPAAQSGFVVALRNYYEKRHVATRYISYAHQAIPGMGYAATVTLSNFNPPGNYTGTGGSIVGAKEAAARAALQALGQLEDLQTV